MNRHLDDILGKLKKVRGSHGRYTACCPAHNDRSPSMTIRETEDGTILMHCFAGCSIGEIADALGIDLSNLFPPSRESSAHAAPPRRRKFLASELLQVIAFESRLIALCAAQIARGTPLSDEDRSRLLVASNRILEALEAANV